MTRAGRLLLVLALVASACGPSITGQAAVSLKVQRAPQTPKNASVSIDENYIGPLSIVAAHGVRLPVGTHRITVEKDGYFPFDRLVTADRDDILLTVTLDPIPD
ncbi:MAG TPA: PEGA domain-containing protein [Polyangiaceae bacterium]|nr:PEGA domain-containing protein [Polyangiaceae bacterium]